MAWDDVSAHKLGTTLRRLREQRGMTQESLAFQAGLTKNTMQLLEAGRASGRQDSAAPSNPRLSSLAGLAEALNISVSDLLTRADM